jgi:hypothetical protein
MKIDILGTEYTLTESNEANDSKLIGRDGYADTSVKKCVVDDMSNAYTGTDAKENLPEYKKSVKRHELIHAFLYESGLDSCSWACNEEMVDWLAIQSPKLLKAFKDADAL